MPRRIGRVALAATGSRPSITAWLGGGGVATNSTTMVCASAGLALSGPQSGRAPAAAAHGALGLDHDIAPGSGGDQAVNPGDQLWLHRRRLFRRPQRCRGQHHRDQKKSPAHPVLRNFSATIAKIAARFRYPARPDRHVIGRLFAFANIAVYVAGAEPVGGLGRKQDMVDADALVLAPGPGLVVPEGILPGLAVAGAEGIGIAQIFDPAQRRPGLRLEQRVIHPGLGIIAILVFGNDVIVAHQRHRLFVGQQLARHGRAAAPARPACRRISRCRSGLPLGA